MVSASNAKENVSSSSSSLPYSSSIPAPSQSNESLTAPISPTPSLRHSPTKIRRERRRSLVQASVRDAMAGAAAGAFAKTAVAPVERIKLLMQLRGSATTNAATGGVNGGATGGGALPTGSAFQVAKSVYETQGVLAFWRGNTPNVVRQAGAAALNFMLMDWYKRAIVPIMHWSLSLPSSRNVEDRVKRRKFIASFLSGGLAGGTTTTVLYPIEFMRTRLAMDVGATKETRLYPRGMRDVFCGIWKSDGPRGLYQGYGIALSGVVVYRALHLGGYDAVKTEILHRRRYLQENGKDNGAVITLSMAERFVAAQIAGQPMDERLYRNSIDCFRKVFASEGLKGFFLGLGPNIIRTLEGRYYSWDTMYSKE